ncbi:hypothetical protein K402DRAFT_388484 [Aulographum hederae CBS 113979]|uniref:Uncharacterized protein n=1 Tax=Aulographum hederae CBS 113979 TaxID=1176131 RepID=A0A6G1HFY3_9PEZI|nr:hypothetical protein K402DRAFT_388484 [Aulographum hederae CBS 113979]
MLASYVRSSWDRKTAESLLFVLLTLYLLPAITFVVILLSSFHRFTRLIFARKRPLRANERRKILLTGSSPSTVTLAHILHAQGHHVTHAEYERFPLLTATRFSNAVRSFHNLYSSSSRRKKRAWIEFSLFRHIKTRFEIDLPSVFTGSKVKTSTFASDILALVQREKPDIWIPSSVISRDVHSSSVLEAAAAVEEHTECHTLHSDRDTAEMLTDEVAFSEFVEQLETGVRVPTVRNVDSRDQIHRLLASSTTTGAKWKLTPLVEPESANALSVIPEANESEEGDGSPKAKKSPSSRNKRDSGYYSDSPSPPSKIPWNASPNKTVFLPLSHKDATFHLIASLPISRHSPWQIRELVTGQKVTVNALILKNNLSAFVASFHRKAAAEGLEESEFIPSTSQLHTSLLNFSQAFVAGLPPDTSTGLALHFVVSGTVTRSGTVSTIFPTSCAIGTHEWVSALASPESPQARTIVRKMLDLPSLSGFAADTETNGGRDDVSRMRPPAAHGPRGLYLFLPSLFHMVVLPLLRDLWHLKFWDVCTMESVLSFWDRALLWEDELFDRRDAWVWWWEWGVKRVVERVLGLGGETR